MNDLQRVRVKHAANIEVVRRQLIKYFMDRQFESFDRSVNPITIQDLPQANTGLESKIEIEPHAIEVDPTTSKAILGWNLFVLGNQRIYLGETHHENLLDLARQIKQGQIQPQTVLMTRRCTTPRRIITFIERVLSNRESGYIDLTPRNRQAATKPRSYRPLGNGGTAESQFYTRSS